MASQPELKKRYLRDSVLTMLNQGKDPNFVRYAHYRNGFDLPEIEDEINNFSIIKNNLPSQQKRAGQDAMQPQKFSDVLSGQAMVQPAKTQPTGMGAQLTAGVAQELGDSNAARDMLLSLEGSIGTKGGSKAFSPIAGQLRAYNPWDTDVQSIQAQINATKQIVGKYLEGGVLRMEDEKKYEKILPKIGDTQEVAQSKLNQVKKLIDEKFQSQTETLGQAGFDVSGLQQQPQQQQPQQPLPTVEGAMEWARNNPGNPASQKIMEAQEKGTLESLIKQKTQPVTPTEPTMTGQPVGQETEPKDDWTSRLWEATKEVVPGLTEDIGKRLKNIWGTVSDRQEKQAKGESIFESVINTQRQQLRGLGEVAGAVGDVAMRAVELAYKTGVDKKTQEAIKTKASEFLQTPQGQEALSVLQQGTEAWGEFKKSNPEIAKDLEASFNIVTAIPAGKGLGMAGKEAGAITSDVATATGKLVGRDAEKLASNQIFRAVKPTLTVKRNKKMVRENLNSANQELVGQGIKPTNFKEYAEGLSTAKKNVWSKIESKITSAGETASVNLKDISDKLKSIASNQNLLRTDKGAAAKIENMADSLISQGKSVSVQDAELIKQYVNSELSGAFGKFNLSNAEQNAKKLITSEIGKQLDDIISKVPGEFSGLKKKYGALREIEEDAMKRLIVFERQNPAGLVDSISRISGVGNIIKGIATLSPSEIAKGAGEIAVGQIQKRANDADLIVKKAFERLYKKSPELKSKILKTIRDKAGLQVDFKSPAVGKTALEQEAKKGVGGVLNNPSEKMIKITKDSPHRASDFVSDMSGQRFFHGTANDFDIFDVSKIGKTHNTDWGNGISLAKYEDLAQAYKRSAIEGTNSKGFVKEFYIDPGAKIYTYNKKSPRDISPNLTDKLKKDGYDALYVYDELGRVEEAVVINPKVIYNESQLTDIWNKSQSIKPKK
jgi:uncharacterized protein YjbJ (UPF0337 family)